MDRGELALLDYVIHVIILYNYVMNKKTYVKYNDNHEIVAVADWNFPGSVEITERVELQLDGTYKSIKYPKLNIKLLQEREKLRKEMENHLTWLKEHDYVGTKIATGRATIDDYSEIIEEMNIKSKRVSEIRDRIDYIEKYGK